MPALMKASLALCLLPTLVSATLPQVYVTTDDPRIVLVNCDEGRGTAFRVGPHHYVSVAHVTSANGCTINGKSFTVRRQEGDFTYLTMRGDEPGLMRVDCGGFIEGRKYIALGHARGQHFLTAVNLIATGDMIGEFSRLVGIATVIPGQSGGPIVDAVTLRPVGTVNVYNAASGESGSVSLSSTSLCKNA